MLQADAGSDSSDSGSDDWDEAEDGSGTDDETPVPAGQPSRAPLSRSRLRRQSHIFFEMARQSARDVVEKAEKRRKADEAAKAAKEARKRKRASADDVEGAGSEGEEESRGKEEATWSPATTEFWQALTHNAVARGAISEFCKLAQILLCCAAGSAEDERAFSRMTFLKDRERNKLKQHLDDCMQLYKLRFWTLKTFPYAQAVTAWQAGAPVRGRYGQGQL